MKLAKKDLNKALEILSKDAVVFAPTFDMIEDPSEGGQTMGEKKIGRAHV